MQAHLLRTRVGSTAVIAALAVACGAGTEPFNAASQGARAAVHTGRVIADIRTDASRYQPGSTVTLTLDVANDTGHDISGGKLALSFAHLEHGSSAPIYRSLSLASGATSALTFQWVTPPADFTGYLVTAVATDSSNDPLDMDSAAVDVSSSWAKFPRYGLMTSNSFGNPSLTSSDANAIMDTMSRFHIDGLQFYDWEYNHDQPLCGTPASPCASWTDDASNRTVYATAIDDLIQSAHQHNIAAMAYNAVYAADNGSCCGAPEYWKTTPVSAAWGLYATPAGDDGRTSPPGGTPLSFYQWDLMDPSNPNWQQYLMQQEISAIQTFHFDGFHGDTFGDPSNRSHVVIGYTASGGLAGSRSDTDICHSDTMTANSTTPLVNAAGTATWMNSTFPSFLRYAKAVLGNRYLAFNPVSFDHAHCEVDTGPVDVLYSELWPNDYDQYWDYNLLKGAIDTGFSESSPYSDDGRGKSVVVAAYQDYGEGRLNAADVLLLDATLFASGGAHEEIGDGGRMLDSEIYTSGAIPMSSSLSSAVAGYYDFMTAYENVLRDGQQNTSQAVSISGAGPVRATTAATPGEVWAFTKSDSTYEIVQLINFAGESSIYWQTGACSACSHITQDHPVPTALADFTLKYYYKTRPTTVLLASPDYNDGVTYSLPFTVGSDAAGAYVSLIIPRLEYWDMIYMRP